MDWPTFEDRLAEAAAAELRERAPELADRTIRCVALDVHPWRGHIGLAVLTDRDPDYESVREQREDMAGWELFELARRGQRWQRVLDLEDWMKTACSGRGPRRDDAPTAAEHADPVKAALEASARALDDDRVTATLAELRISSDFERFVGHPDDSEQTNLCRPR